MFKREETSEPHLRAPPFLPVRILEAESQEYLLFLFVLFFNLSVTSLITKMKIHESLHRPLLQTYS